MSLLSIACAAFFMLCSAIFFYYLYMTIKGYLRCKSERNDELPCPNTCDPGYECKQSEAAADFVIGDVVQEGVSEDDKQQDAAESTEVAEEVEFTEVVEELETPDAPKVETTI